MSLWRERLIGVMLLCLVVLLTLAAASHLVSSQSGEYIATQVRILDSLRPHLLLLVLLNCCALALLRERRIALAGLVGAGLVLVSIVADYRARSAPALASKPDVTLLWFNMLQENQIAPDVLATALLDSGADVIAIGESRNAAALPDLLADQYPYSLRCSSVTLETCGILLLSRLPFDGARQRDLPSGRKRFTRLRLSVPDREPLNLIFMHMVKPWYLGMAAAEREALDAALGGPKDLPLVLMGDFNAAPWSRRMRQVEQKHGLRHAAFPVATWPVEAGPFGLPIDHVLVRGRAELVSVDPWGAHLGSNHRGLKAKLALQRTMP